MSVWVEPKNNYKAEDQVLPTIFNVLAENERYLKEVKITIEQVKDAVIAYTASGTRVNIASGDTIKTAFGKIQKWFADLGSLAFKSTVGTSDISSQAVTDAKIKSVAASKVTGLAKVATSGSYNDLKDKPSAMEMVGKVVWSGSIDYFDSLLNFTLKAGYRYLIEISTSNGKFMGEGIAFDSYGTVTLSVIIPGYCYAEDSVYNIHIVYLQNYSNGTQVYYDGGANIYNEGSIDISEEGTMGNGSFSTDGQYPSKLTKVIELEKVF